MIEYLLGILCLFLAFLFLGAETITADLRTGSVFEYWARHWPPFARWWKRQGNTGNDPSMIWTSDPWHAFRHLWMNFIAFAIFFFTGDWPWLLGAIFFGRSFILGYNTLWRQKTASGYKTVKEFWQDTWNNVIKYWKAFTGQ